MKRRPSIAVALYGLPRCSAVTVPSIEKQILAPHVVRHAIRHPRVCAVPGWQWHHGCNDRFAICGREAAAVYANRGRLLADFCGRHDRPAESEELLLEALCRERLPIVALPLRASRVRLGGVIRHERFTGRCPRRPVPLFRLWGPRLAYALVRRDWFSS